MISGSNHRTNAGGSHRDYASAAGFIMLVCGMLALTAPVVRAEKADRDKPIHLEADRVTVDDAKQVAVFEGNVVLTQGTLVIRGNRMEVREDKEGFKNATTWGNLAYFKQKRDAVDEYIEGWAERIEYDGQADKLQMFIRASMRRGQDEVHGNYISYDGKTEFFQVIGGGRKAATTGNPEGRVRAVMQPKSKEKPAGNPPVNLKPADNLTPPPENIGKEKK